MTAVVRLLAAVAALFAAPAAAQTAFFDLDGPSLAATVTRGDRTLPLARVLALKPGDRLQIRATFPAEQSERYLLVLAFLRGATNPPPEDWFHRARTWRAGRDDALDVTVPAGAGQAVLFLAPNTGGGYDAIRDAVRGRPGIFVRAARDLAQASLDRSRLDAFVAGVRAAGDRDPDDIEAASTTLARSLAVQPDAECLRRQPRSQAACLTQDRDQITLFNSRGTSLAETLTGAPADIAFGVSATAVGGAGAYSPYLSVVRDIGRLLGAFQSADYQYIPALTVGRGEGVGLLLNTAPSFDAPQSVMVAALPPIGETTLAPPRLAAPPGTVCAAAESLVVPVDDAPLLYSTELAWGVTLDIRGADGRTVSVPLAADATRGGLVPAAGAAPALPEAGQASLSGSWGFDPIASPRFRVAGPGEWRRAENRPLAPGREERVTLTGGNPSCVAAVTLESARGDVRPLEWAGQGGVIAVTIPAGAAGETLAIRQHGADEPVTVALDRALPDRPALTVVSRTVEPVEASGPRIDLADENAFPAGGRLTFSVAAADVFRPDDVIEIAAATGGRSVKLTGADGYRLQDPRVAVATIVPARALGSSAFGPLRIRLVRDEMEGEWQPLGTLVRVPTLRAATCEPGGGCTITGSDLFLIAAISPDAAFGDAVEVPSGFTGGALRVPAATSGRLHLRLRDAPDVDASVQTGP